MGSDEFFRTRMGHQFFESTLPKLADQLERLNANLEAIVAELRKNREAAQPTPSELIESAPRGSQ